MKNLTLIAPDNGSDDSKTIPNFFEDYPIECIEQKLWDCCSNQIFNASSEECISTVVNFFGSLIKVLKNCVALNNEAQAIPITSFSEHTLISLEGIINLIKQAIPVGVIYNLGRASGQLDLLVVLEKSCTKSYAEYENIIDLAMLGYENGTCTIHNYGLLNTQLHNGHLFYVNACVEENVVYRRDTTEVFRNTNQEKLMLSKQRLTYLFANGMDRAIAFYDGAQHYLTIEAFGMTMFMLHQACELTYRCLLNGIRGKDLKCHSPAILRKHIKRFAPEIIGVFSPIEDEELEYLRLLEDAYVKSRYETRYTVNKALIIFLNERVGLLHVKAKEVVERLTK